MRFKNNLMFIYSAFIFCFLLWYNGRSIQIDFDNIVFNLENNISYNIKIFDTIKSMYYGVTHGYYDLIYRYIAGNIFLYIPLGFFAFFNSVSDKYKLMRNIIFCMIFIFFKEVVQFLFDIGSFDIDTIILNLTGVIIGMAIYCAYIKYLKRYICIFFKKCIKYIADSDFFRDFME